MAANTLFLRLEGPMQSWGERARWSVRDTAPEPTKSGIVGLLGCALGIADDAGLREISDALRMGVRCDRPGTRLVDYHTVGGGYAEPALLTAEGKPKISSGAPHTEQTWRSYLCDASFLVAVQGPPEMIARLADAVQAPHWPIYLGRKACVPTRPPFDGTGAYPDLECALQDHARYAGQVRAVIECAPSDPNAVRRRDAIDSHARWTFRSRYTCEKMLTLTADKEVPCTSPA
jgi:CRISPR system Cascade subunit CasD